MKRFGIALFAAGIASLAHAADLPTTKAPAPEKAKPNCWASLWDWLKASAADCPLSAYGVTLYGTDGGADINVVNYVTDDTLTIYTDTAGVPAIVRPRLPKGGGHAAVVRNFVTAIRSGDWSTHNGSEGLRRAQIIDACYQSALQGREISLVAPQNNPASE